MSSMVEKVKDFMHSAGQTTSINNVDQCNLYYYLICEEYKEWEDSLNLTEELKELCDIIWVNIAHGLSRGFDIEGAFQEVYRSNMSKLVDGKLLKREDGKVLKPDTYSPANVLPFINTVGY